ncbi:chemotaxis protein CheD [Actinoplanes sp. NPDC051411]|uniref:chemotaxis protein CheD n=1 Tax=Actinoplanes sp. NPDC051411 TaxID=3155522 RepID=UPI003426170E
MTDIFLHPGDYWFGDDGSRIHTVLGSCVSITAWHPARRIGGMCHYMLPARHAHLEGSPDARYADGAVALFLRDMRRTGTAVSEYEVKMFGGSEQFPHLSRPSALDVAGRNINSGRELLERHGFILSSRNLGGVGPRRLIFEIATGAVWVRSVGIPGRASA